MLDPAGLCKLARIFALHDARCDHRQHRYLGSILYQAPLLSSTTGKDVDRLGLRTTKSLGIRT
jgi:hypothetical protein